MKKNGFTLAEVLITLTIIGVIATMTLPALMTNTQEQQAKTALKKGISTLTDISQMNQAIDGYDFSGLKPGKFGDSDPDTRSLFAMLANRGSIDLQKSFQGTIADTDTSTKTLDTNGGTVDSIVYFRDGSAVLYSQAASETKNANGVLLADGLPTGFTVIFDTNGKKGPNVLSNCLGNTTGAVDTAVGSIYSTTSTDLGKTEETALTNACIGDNIKKRVIKDQFMVRLRGGVAVPYGAAAVWAYNN